MTRRGSGQRGGEPGPVVSYVDHALLLARSAGQDAVLQALWIYDGPVDVSAVEAVRCALADEQISRLIARSPVPFGRPRWVRAPAPSDDLEVAGRPRPIEELFAWADEQVDGPLDPVHGPPWRMSLLPLTDGRAVVSLVVSHCVADAIGAFESVSRAAAAVVDGAGDRDRRVATTSIPVRRSAMVRADLHHLVADLPAVARGLVRALRMLMADRPWCGGVARSPVDHGTGLVTMPTVAAFVDLAVWNESAESLGGTSSSLLTGVTVRLAERLERVRDGRVLLLVPLQNAGDERGRVGGAESAANSVTLARIAIDPSDVVDHNRLRAVVRAGIAAARDRPDPTRALLPLVPFVPRRLVGALAETAFGFAADRPVNLSGLGDLPAGVLRIGGTPADRLCFRGVDRKVVEADLARRGGVLTVAAGAIGGSFVVNVTAADPTRPATREELRHVVAEVLGDFGVTAEIV